MGKRTASSGTMPVLLVRFGKYRVSDKDPLRLGTPGLHPAFALDDDHQLAAGVGMPVITDAGLESNERRRRRRQWPRCRQEGMRACLSGEVGRVEGREVA